MIAIEHIITLQGIKGIGPVALGKICDRINRMNSSSMDLGQLYDLVEGMVRAREVTRVTMPEYQDFEKAYGSARHILALNDRLGIGVVSRYDEAFPKNLLHTVSEDGKPAVPVLLYYKGDLSITGKPALAVIGTREPTPDGVQAGHYYAEAFASIGVNIVSGLALGCDTAGHHGALDAGGVTTAFLAHGLDTVYPAENKSLAMEIVDNGGLLMSEYPVGVNANRYNLIARDRLQAGLADATLVVQTAVKGGTMHAVRATKAAGKPLLVVNYRNNQGEKAAGNALLEQEGAIGFRAKADEIKAKADDYIRLIRPGNRAEDEQIYRLR